MTLENQVFAFSKVHFGAIFQVENDGFEAYPQTLNQQFVRLSCLGKRCSGIFGTFPNGVF